MKKILGLCGLAGSGKSTVGALLATLHGFTQYAFADPLKDGLATMLGIPREWMEDQERKTQIVQPYGVTLRHMLQSLGTEWGRNLIHRDVWLLRAEAIVNARLDDISFGLTTDGLVITDVRFDNEAAFVRRHGTLLHIVRDNAGLQGTAGDHVSELGIAVAEGDVVIHNDGTLEDLRYTVEALVSGVPEAGRSIGGVFVGLRIQGTALFADPVASARWIIRQHVQPDYCRRLGEVVGGNGRYQALTMRGEHVGNAPKFAEAAKLLAA